MESKPQKQSSIYDEESGMFVPDPNQTPQPKEDTGEKKPDKPPVGDELLEITE